MEFIKPQKRNQQYTITLDDDPMIRRLIERYTQIKSLPFTSARKLSEQAHKLNPTAAFIDIHLGYEECSLDILYALKKQWPLCPLIVITSDPDAEMVKKALSSGADDFVRKPIVPEELTDIFFS